MGHRTDILYPYLDEESLEDAKKKIKSLETQVKDLVGMNDNLRGYVREKFGEHKSTGGGEGAAPPEPSANTSPTIFTAKKVKNCRLSSVVVCLLT